jgi:hypothetical protein
MLPKIYNLAVTGLAADRIGGPLRAPAQGHAYVQDWAQRRAPGQELVVITLRNHPGGPARNSDLASWIAFANSLDAARFCPVFVPDTLDALSVGESQYGGHAVFPVAAHNMGLRAALYEAAYLNLFVSNGPASICILDSRCRYLLFKLTVPQIRMTSADFLTELGFKPDHTPDFSDRFQKWVWQDDQITVLQDEFRDMSVKIDAAQNAGVSL